MDVLNFLMTLMKFIQKITFMFVVSMMMELQHLANVGLMLDRSPRQVFEPCSIIHGNRSRIDGFNPRLQLPGKKQNSKP